MATDPGHEAPCAVCGSLGWIEEVHPSGRLARVAACPASCEQGRLMEIILPASERGWYLRRPVVRTDPRSAPVLRVI